jgi:L-ascorbate metabolism protein UlaG (beta-lactamase superfamily)
MIARFGRANVNLFFQNRQRQRMSIEITWLGHSTWWIKSGDFRILIDPFIGGNPAASVASVSLDPTHILISHGHFDHIADAAEIANRSQAIVVSNYEIATWLETKHGVKGAIGMNLGGKTNLPFGTVQFTQAVHSSILPDGSYGGACGGFLVQFNRKNASGENSLPPYCLYYAGDTALFSDLALIARHGVDCLIVPIGDLFTMGPEDSIEAIQMVRPKIVLPTHYNTWPPIVQDAAAWVKSVHRATSAKAIAPKVNDVTTLVV